MAGEKVVDVVRFPNVEVAPLGETVSIVAETGSGEKMVLRFDAEFLENSIPTLMGLAEHARRKAEAGLPAIGEVGESFVVRAMPISSFRIHPSKDPPKISLEFHISPHGFPLVMSLPQESARQLCNRVLQTLDQG
jgi:hypothetical protein